MSAITVYYDASCPLCLSEMSTIKALDHANDIVLSDCSAAEFCDPQAAGAGITQLAMMRLIHARTSTGEWLIGIDVFVDLYRRVGLHSVSKFWAHPWLSPVLRLLYPWIARYRLALSRLGINRIYEHAIERAARNALAKSQACSENQCELPPS